MSRLYTGFLLAAEENWTRMCGASSRTVFRNGSPAGRCWGHDEGEHHELCPDHPTHVTWRADAAARAASTAESPVLARCECGSVTGDICEWVGDVRLMTRINGLLMHHECAAHVSGCPDAFGLGCEDDACPVHGQEALRTEIDHTIGPA